MNERMRTGMADATRLTRAGQLLEATDVIQRTLRGMLAPEVSSDSAHRSAGEQVDVTCHLLAAVPPPSKVSDQRGDHQTHTSAAATPPPPDVAPPPSGGGKGYAEPTDPQPDLRDDQPRGAPSTSQHASGSKPADGRKPADFTPAPPTRPARFRPPLHFPRSGLGGPLSVPMPDRAREEVWAGGQFIEGSYTNPAGTRTYKLYIPSGYRGQAVPVVVMLHGCTQNPDDFAAGTRMNVLAERELFFVVYPAQATPANQSKCWNWFKATDQQRGRGEPSIIAGITSQIVSSHQLDARRVYVAGLSAGGAMAAIMAVSYPDVYAAIGVHSGLAYGAAHDLPSAFAAMQHGGVAAVRQPDGRLPAAGTRPRIVPTIVFHGDRDTTVHPRNGDQVLAQWGTVDAGAMPEAAGGTKLRVSVNQGQVPQGHAYTRSVYEDASGRAVMERWLVHGAGHGWSGGSPHGSFTDPQGPDASREMVRFFLEHLQRES